MYLLEYEICIINTDPAKACPFLTFWVIYQCDRFVRLKVDKTRGKNAFEFSNFNAYKLIFTHFTIKEKVKI